MIASFCARCFRRFTACAREDYYQAAIEVAVICMSAFVPLWAGLGLFSMAKRPGSAAKYAFSLMTSGEMLLIACAIIGPLIYVITRKYGKFADPLTLRFPYGTGFSLMIVVIWFIAGGVFVSKKASDLYGAELFDDDAMWNLSAGITIAAVAILYIATVFRNCMDRIDPGPLMHDEQEKFVKDFSGA